MSCDLTVEEARAALDERVRESMQWHFSPETGCPYWLEPVQFNFDEAEFGSAACFCSPQDHFPEIVTIRTPIHQNLQMHRFSVMPLEGRGHVYLVDQEFPTRHWDVFRQAPGEPGLIKARPR